MIEHGLFLYLKSNSTLAELLPSANAIWMGFVPENAEFPCVMFMKVSSEPDSTLQGPSGFVSRRYQFTCYGKDVDNQPNSGYVSAQTLSDAIRQQFEGLSEVSPTTLPDDTLLFNIIPDTALDSYDADQEVHHAIQDYIVLFQSNP